MGVAGAIQAKDNWIIDPEALLLFTMDAGRYDPRLFDEVADWTLRNEKWISLQRLKSIAEHWEKDAVKRTLVAFAGLLNSLEKKQRWRSLSQMDIPPIAQTAPFFMNIDGKPLPTIAKQDELFAQAGFIRSPIILRNLSQRASMNTHSALLIRFRALFGIGPRVEVIAYLLAHGISNVAELARITEYSRPPIREILNDLAEGDFVSMSQHNKQKSYSVDIERWKRFIEISDPLPLWIEWPRVFRALSELLSFLMEIEKKEPSDYMLRSRLLSLHEKLNHGLAESGLPNPFAKPVELGNAVEEFERQVEILMDELNGG